MLGRPIKLVRVSGIPISVHPSWFLILFLVILSFTDNFKDATATDTEAFLFATGTALLFFGSIVLHEMGHALVAVRNKIEISGIDLWLFGGIAKMSRGADSAGVEFRVAAAGPLVTVLIAALCFGIGALTSHSSQFWDAMRFQSSVTLASPWQMLLALLASINILLLIFNLLPAFPLDGGRIARAAAWKLTGDRTRATNFAAGLGQLISYVMVGLGIFDALFAGNFIGGLWLVFIGMFIRDAARAEAFQTAVLSKIEGVKVSDVMDAEPIAVPGDMTISEALNEFFLRYRYPWFPVVDSSGRYLGVVDRSRAERVAEDRQSTFTVREIMQADAFELRVHSDDPLEALIASEPLRRLGALMAVDGDGRLLGIVTIDDIRRALERGAPSIVSR